jgi:hypothetical protein
LSEKERGRPTSMHALPASNEFENGKRAVR